MNWKVDDFEFNPESHEMLRRILSYKIGRETIERICRLCSSSEASMDTLFAFIGSPDDRVGYNALWVMTHFDSSQRCRIEGKKSDLIDFVLKEKHTGKRRLLLAIIEKMPIYNKEEVRGDFIDFCLSKINSDEPYGVRALCMKLAFAQCRFFPELINELEAELEMMEQEQLSPGLLAAKRNVMRHLVNIK